MRKYEIMFILDPSEEKYTKGKEDIKNYIDSLGGTIDEEKDMGIRVLAYNIKKRDKGFYYLVYASLDPSKLNTLNQEVRINEQILKYMPIVLN